MLPKHHLSPSSCTNRYNCLLQEAYKVQLCNIVHNPKCFKDFFTIDGYCLYPRYQNGFSFPTISFFLCFTDQLVNYPKITTAIIVQMIKNLHLLIKQYLFFFFTLFHFIKRNCKFTFRTFEIADSKFYISRQIRVSTRNRKVVIFSFRWIRIHNNTIIIRF